MCAACTGGTTDPWLAKSPDGIIEDLTQTEGRHSGILEIKCLCFERNRTAPGSFQRKSTGCSAF